MAVMNYLTCPGMYNTKDWGRVKAMDKKDVFFSSDQTEIMLSHLVNSIPGGIASYRFSGGRFIPVYFSDGVTALSGHTREEYEEMVKNDALDIIYQPDRRRVLEAADRAMESGAVLDVSYRMRHKNGQLIWIHLNGRRVGPLSEDTRFYAVFTGLSPESRLYQNIATETADGIYVVAKENFELLYVNESNGLFAPGSNCLGEKCYEALRRKSSPCRFCILSMGKSEGEEYEIMESGEQRIYRAHCQETDWNGIPAYIKYVHDVTDEVNTRREKERLDIYFRTIVENFPGGISVMRCLPDGRMTPEFISSGFAAMMQRTEEELRQLYEEDAYGGMHPDDVESNYTRLRQFIKGGQGHCELIARMRRPDNHYFWIRSVLSILPSAGRERRVYIVYTDISREIEEKEQLRRQYEEILAQHYRKPGRNELVLGHCNITRNRIIEIRDSTDSGLLEAFGDNRDEFFTGIGGLVVEEEERNAFLNTYLNEPSMKAFEQNRTEQILNCFIKLPREPYGRYVQFKVNMVETPDTGDITGILTVTDITDQTISHRILHQMSAASSDFVADLDLGRDSFTVLSCKENIYSSPGHAGCHSRMVEHMAHSAVAPKDRRQYAEALEPGEIRRRLKNGPYTISYSVKDESGELRVKNMTVSAIDMRLERVCLVRTDITDSVREQQRLLNVIAYTFESMGFLDISSRAFTVYTRDMVLNNLPPAVIPDYGEAVRKLKCSVVSGQKEGGGKEPFYMESILGRLEKEPAGYDFVAAYQTDDGVRYKQVNVLWGDADHSTICMVRVDVTDMLAAERRTKNELEKALALAREANQAKSDFLSAMSHDIRTPMNAITGMTTLAVAHMDDPERVKDCLQKISVSSRHLLSLINDVLDMSRIERSKITLSRTRIMVPVLLEQLTAITAPQAREQRLEFSIQSGHISQTAFYGDSLRINQILINLLSNAIKFTPPGGSVEFLMEEIDPVKALGSVRYRFTVRDTGIGMDQDFLDSIFEPFSRGRTEERIEGTGLGLSITKGLVDRMEGSISVESRKGQGSTFRVELEFEPAPADGWEKREGARPTKKETIIAGRNFLVAEDNEINSEILCELLSMQGAACVLKTDGAQAVQAFREAKEGTFDAILMDIQMPEMNGYEATRAIRAMDRADARTIPIIAMTANAFSEDIKLSVEAGMTAHVPKPMDMDVLHSALSRAFEQGRYPE